MTTTNDDNDEQLLKPTGSTMLYVIFLTLMILGGLLTELLLPPSALQQQTTSSETDGSKSTESQDDLFPVASSENTSLLPSLDQKIQEHDDSNMQQDLLLSTQTTTSSSSCWENIKGTLTLFSTSRPMLTLSILFFYTGFNQPYQQATFSRFFTKRTIGMELILFHLMEIVGSIVCGRLLDYHNNKGGGGEEDCRPSRRVTAMVCLFLFLIINGWGNCLALVQEYQTTSVGVVVPVDISDWTHPDSLRQSSAFLLWGWADAQIQVYCYWIMGTLFGQEETRKSVFSSSLSSNKTESSQELARAVAFYKCLQSLGYTIGFCLIPTTRISAMYQLVVSSGIFVLGTILAFWQVAAP